MTVCRLPDDIVDVAGVGVADAVRERDLPGARERFGRRRRPIQLPSQSFLWTRCLAYASRSRAVLRLDALRSFCIPLRRLNGYFIEDKFAEQIGPR